MAKEEGGRQEDIFQVEPVYRLCNWLVESLTSSTVEFFTKTSADIGLIHSEDMITRYEA